LTRAQNLTDATVRMHKDDDKVANAERTGRIRSVLSAPWLFRAYQKAVGANAFKREVIETYLKPQPGQRLLDVGCGTGDVVEYLQDVDYLGFDVNERYVAHARDRFGAHADFRVANVLDIDARELGSFDLAHGLLHHLQDVLAARVCALAAEVLMPSGRFVTADPCLHTDQSPLARFTVSMDRGNMVRTLDGYRALAEPSFGRVHSIIDHSPLRIPHTTAVLVCAEPNSAPGG
jgi:SAM-dependent methyltransferase